MFTKQQDSNIKEWNKQVDRYISLHKYLRDVGKIAIVQGRSGRINKEVQEKLKESLEMTEKALQQLKLFFKPCLTDVDVTDFFPEEKTKVDTEGLAEEIARLRKENEYLQQHLKDVPDSREKGRVPEDTIDSQTLHMQKRFDEMLKTQNDLIYDLKQELDSSRRERDIFRSLNNHLEAELRKKTMLERDENLVRDYHNHIMLKAGENTTVDYEGVYEKFPTLQLQDNSEQERLFKMSKSLEFLEFDKTILHQNETKVSDGQAKDIKGTFYSMDNVKTIEENNNP